MCALVKTAALWPFLQLGQAVCAVLKRPLPLLSKALAVQTEIKVPRFDFSVPALGHPPHVDTVLCAGRLIPGPLVAEMAGLLDSCTDHVCSMYRDEHCSMTHSRVAASVFGECFDEPCGFFLGILSTLHVREKIEDCKREMCKRKTRRFSGLSCVHPVDMWQANVRFDNMFCRPYALSACRPRLDYGDLLVWGTPPCNSDICPGRFVPDDHIMHGLRRRHACLFYTCRQVLQHLSILLPPLTVVRFDVFLYKKTQ
jgi:hypothetical protein